MSTASTSWQSTGSAAGASPAQGGTAATSFSETLARFAATASGARYRELVSLQVADAVIALLAGMDTAEGRSIRAFIERADGRSALGASAWLAASMRLSEIDDIHRPSAVTSSAIALPAALAMLALTKDARCVRFTDALFVGQELSIRLARALGGASLMTQGWWPSYLVAPFGAAATAGRMLGLPAERMKHALALSISQTPHQIGRTAGARPGRWLLFGNAVRSGCLAALAAADGIEGDVDLLNEPWLRRIGGDKVDIRWLGQDAFGASASAGGSASASAGGGGALALGVDADSEGDADVNVDDPRVPAITQISAKPHCSAKQTLAVIHGLRELITAGLDPATIESIELRVPRAYAAMLDREPPTAGRLASLLSARGQLALAALRPAALDDVARDTLTWTDDLVEFAARVRVEADASLDASYPARWPARLSVRAAGTVHEITVEESPGDPSQRFTMAAIEDKARRVLGAHRDIGLVETGRRAPKDDMALDSLCHHFLRTD